MIDYVTEKGDHEIGDRLPKGAKKMPPRPTEGGPWKPDYETAAWVVDDVAKVDRIKADLAATDAGMARVTEDQVLRFDGLLGLLVAGGAITQEQSDQLALPQAARDKMDARDQLRDDLASV